MLTLKYVDFLMFAWGGREFVGGEFAGWESAAIMRVP